MIPRMQRVAAVIAAHPDHQVVGETRLQKTIKLLQRVGLETDYSYSLHFYGPYSEELQMETQLLDQMGLITEGLVKEPGRDAKRVFSANGDLPDLLADLRDKIDQISKSSTVAVELAATYDSFREIGFDHQTALDKLRMKKRTQCNAESEAAALRLLTQLGLN